MTTTTLLFAVHMIASGAVRLGLLLVAIWAVIRLVDRLRTPIVVAQPQVAATAPAAAPVSEPTSTEA